MKYIISFLLLYTLSSNAELEKYPTGPQIKSLISENTALYSGTNGQIRFAEEFFRGNMKLAIKRTKAAIDKKLMKKLAWQKSQGMTTGYITHEERLLTINGEVKSEVKAIKGQVEYADLHYRGDMLKAYQEVSSSFSQDKFSQLLWQKFPGNTTMLKIMREILYHSSADKVDYEHWHGKSNGLDRAVLEYLDFHTYDYFVQTYDDVSYSRKTLQKVRKAFMAAVSIEEKIELGWDTSRSKKPKIINRMSAKMKKNSAVDPMTSVKRAIKK